MDRAQFMEQLKRLLSDIPDYEREEALDYYENYFDDAGPENEASVIRELGSPGKVAAIIKADLQYSAGNDDYAKYTERGYEDDRTKEAGQMPDKYTAVSRRVKPETNTEDTDSQKSRAADGGRRQDAEGESGTDNSGEEREKSSTYRRTGNHYDRTKEHSRSERRAGRGYRAGEKKGNATGILLLILLVFLSPVITGAAGGIFGVLIAIILLPFLLIFALGAGGIGCLIGAVACISAGIAVCVSSPAAGILMMGIGCILAAIGIVLLVLAVWAGGKLIPWLLRKITDLIHNILNRRRKGEQE